MVVILQSKLEKMAESKRFTLPDLGEWYRDQLAFDAWINNRSVPIQGQSLLCAKLQERESTIEKRLDYIANKRGISVVELKSLILDGKALQATKDEEGQEP